MCAKRTHIVIDMCALYVILVFESDREMVMALHGDYSDNITCEKNYLRLLQDNRKIEQEFHLRKWENLEELFLCLTCAASLGESKRELNNFTPHCFTCRLTDCSTEISVFSE